jgi:serine/threonine protein kinase
MDANGLIIGIAIMSTIGTGWFFLLRHLARRRQCPGCGVARVPNVSICPFCNAAYDAGVLATRIDRSPSPGPTSAPVLICIEGPVQGQSFPLISSEYTLGRGSHNSLRLEGNLVSRSHALINFKDEQHFLYDQESTNGTYVNGQRVSQHRLCPGDQIQIGPHVLVFQPPGVDLSPSQAIPPRVETFTPPTAQIRSVDFGDYQVLETIGGGGMATVYKGQYLDGTIVAIKVFHHSDPYLRDKFEQEIRIGISLQDHPHIARVYGGDALDGFFYMVMEYVDNFSLRERLRLGQKLPQDAIITIAGQMCDALSYAHARGVIHRDIKPENILFSSREGVKLVDFGIAKLSSARTYTMDGVLVGTSYYMSYEQAQGMKVDPRSDLYSLGVVLYEMLTGQVPFRGEPLTVVHKHIHEQPVPPRRLDPSIPAHVEGVVMRALEKNAGKRFQSAEEMARSLGYDLPFFSPGVLPARPLSHGEQRLVARHETAMPAAHLVAVDNGQTIHLTPGTTIIQRSDLLIPDPRMSRSHAKITCHGEHFWLEDIESTNGTYLNEIRIFEPALLRSGDTIRLGQTRLRFECAGQ